MLFNYALLSNIDYIIFLGEIMDFWEKLQTLVNENSVKIDRPAGSVHPRYNEIVYPLDYGYLEGTTSGDGAEIDVWVGSENSTEVTGIAVTVDTLKKDSEIKLLLGCNEKDKEKIACIINNAYMNAIFIDKP